MPPTTPTKRPNAPSGFKHLDTPTKSRIRGVKEFVAFLDQNDLTPKEGSSLRNIAKCFGPDAISKSSIARALSSTTDRRRLAEDRRGRGRSATAAAAGDEGENDDAENDDNNNNGDGDAIEPPEPVNYDSLRADLQIPAHISDTKIRRALGRHFGSVRDRKGRFRPRSSTTPARPKKSHKKSVENVGANSNDDNNNNTLPQPEELLYQSHPQAMFDGMQLQGPNQGVLSNEWNGGIIY